MSEPTAVYFDVRIILVSCKPDEFVNTECVTLQPKVKMEKLSVSVCSYIRKIRVPSTIKEFIFSIYVQG
jgi:hypothetical protein